MLIDRVKRERWVLGRWFISWAAAPVCGEPPRAIMEVDFSQLDFATATKVDEVIRKDYNERLVRAAARQRRIAAINHLHRPLAKEGFGERTLMIDPVFDAYWRECYGKDYTHDPELLKFLLKRNPEIGVQSRGSKQICVGWMPGSTSKKPIGLK